MIFKYISDILIYITSVSHALIYLWRLTSLNKHEHCSEWMKAPVNGSLKGTDSLEKRFDGIFILSDKVAFVSAVLLCVQLLPWKPLFQPLQKRLLLAENQFAFSISPSSNTFLLLLTLFFFFLQQLSALFTFFILADALLFQSIRIISICYSLKLKILT